MSVEREQGRGPDGTADRGKRCGQCKRFARLLPGQMLCDSCMGCLPLEFPTGRRLTPGEVMERLVAEKQRVGSYVVALGDAEAVRMRLTQAQAEGYVCLSCQCPNGTGHQAFRPVGWARPAGQQGGSQIFRCEGCLDGGDR